MMIFSNENSKVDVSIMIDDYSVEGAFRLADKLDNIFSLGGIRINIK